MDEPDHCLRRPDRAGWSHEGPGPAPRPVPLAVQWQLFDAKPAVVVGMLFVVVSSAFLVALLSDAGGLHSLWQVFPLLHLAVGLGLAIVPLVLWRRRVAILKHGRLAPARIVAAQDRGGTAPHGEGSMVNTAGPWLDFERSFAQAQSFWTKTRIDAPRGRPRCWPGWGAS